MPFNEQVCWTYMSVAIHPRSLDTNSADICKITFIFQGLGLDSTCCKSDNIFFLISSCLSVKDTYLHANLFFHKYRTKSCKLWPLVVWYVIRLSFVVCACVGVDF